MNEYTIEEIQQMIHERCNVNPLLLDYDGSSSMYGVGPSTEELTKAVEELKEYAKSDTPVISARSKRNDALIPHGYSHIEMLKNRKENTVGD